MNPQIARAPRRALASLLAILVFAGLALAAIPASSAHAADSTNGISGAPSDGTGSDDRSRFSYQVDPGQHLDDFYLVRNTGSTPQNMKIFATDAFDTPQGDYSLLETAAKPKDAGSWVTFANGQPSIDVPLAPGESKIVSFRLIVPADATPGDHAGGIVISVATPQGNIVVDRRVATRMYVRVKGDIQAALNVSGVNATYLPSLNPFGGSTRVRFTIKNTGNVALGANLVTSMRTYLGIGASGLTRSSVDEMLPRSTRVVTVVVPGVAQLGYLAAHVNLVPTVDADALSPGPLHTVDRESALFVMPWWLLIILVIAGAIVLFIRIRRRIDRRRAAEWIAHTEAEVRRQADEAVVSRSASEGDADGELVAATHSGESDESRDEN